VPDDAERPRRIRIERNGPMLVEGPVTVTGDDGVAHTSERFIVAVCTCRRSRTYPWCDTSHRRRGPAQRNAAAGAGAATDSDSGSGSGSGSGSSSDHASGTGGTS
jgi:CDGSH-type Zn-finger protein